jgi:type I restriction enzyme M protein
MVEMTAPTPKDMLCNPAVIAGEYLQEREANLFADPKLNHHFHHGLFHGFENDASMLRIGSMS